MKKFIVMFFISIASYAQKNSIYAEVSLEVLTATTSVNYERKLSNNIFARAGFGLLYSTIGGISGNSGRNYMVPVSFHYLAPVSANSFIDIGLGPNLIGSTFSNPEAPKNILYLFTNIGFRKNGKNNLFWRIHITPYTINLTKKKYSYGNDVFRVVEEINLPRTWVGFSMGKYF